jgi:hypothetical protein
MNQLDNQLETPWTALKIAYGLVPLLAGIDKFLNLLVFWPKYLSPALAAGLPVTPEVFMRTIGVVEIVVGLLILTRWTMVGSYIAAVWLLCIAANLVLAGFFDVAVRDVVLAIGAFTLARLTEVRGSSEVGMRRTSAWPHAA